MYVSLSTRPDITYAVSVLSEFADKPGLMHWNAAMTLYRDNQGAIALTHDHQYHAWTKHINIHFYFICWIVSEGKLKLVYCPTENMIANTLTKALPSMKVKHFTYSLGLCKD